MVLRKVKLRMNSKLAISTAMAVGIGAIAVSCGRGLDSKGLASSTPAVPAPEAPVLTLDIQQTKKMNFTWPDIANETSYKLYKDATGSSGFTLVKTLAADAVTTDVFETVLLGELINAQYKLQACNSVGCTDSNVVTVSGTLDTGIGYVKTSNSQTSDTVSRVSLSKDGNVMAVGAVGEGSNATGVNGDQSNNSRSNSGAVYVFVRNAGVWTQQADLKASNTGSGNNFGSSISLSDDGKTLAVAANNENSAGVGVGGTQTNSGSNNSGAVYVFTYSSGAWSQQAYIKASNAKTGDQFGWSTKLSGDGNSLIVGAFNEDSAATGINGDETSTAAANAGAAYIFVRSGVNWTQQAYLKASNAGAGDVFGQSVALSEDGRTAVVSACGETSNASGINGNQSNNSLSGAGAAYVFVSDGTTWTQQAYIKASNPGAYDQFGQAVAISGDGNTVLVGAYGEKSSATGVNGNQSDDSLTTAGAAYVFTRSGTTWSQQAYLKSSHTRSSGVFGWYVSLSSDGNKAAIGGYTEPSSGHGVDGVGGGTVTSTGTVYLFKRTGTTWANSGHVKSSNARASDNFGYVLALSGDGNDLAVTAYGEDSAATGIGGDQASSAASNSGAVYLY